MAATAAGQSEVQARRADGLALDAPTLVDAFLRTAERHADRLALRTFGGGLEIDWGEYRARVERLAGGLRAAGIGHGDTVAIMLTNRPEAMLVDTAAMRVGAIPFSIYNTSSVEQVRYLLEHARSRLIVTEAQFAGVVHEAAGRLATPIAVHLADGESGGAASLSALDAAPLRADDLPALRGDDVATLIYTSGTTGPPKAVELTHDNLLCQGRMFDAVFPLRPAGRLVSYLPAAHLADRYGSHYTSLLTGSTITFVDDIGQVPAALVEVHPTTWGAVPRVWEKMQAALEAGFAADPDDGRRAAVQQALAASLARVRAEQAARAGVSVAPPAPIAPGDAPVPDPSHEAIFAAIRERLGLDQVGHLLSGAAPIAPDVLEFFAALGLPICEVWGMSETSLIATINPADGIRIGTVGVALPGVELRLAEDGELLVRAPIVMRGYRDDPVRTAEAIGEDGWLRTGDIAEIDGDGYVRIVDRKKELIINAGGKNMSPANIESKLKAACPLVGSAVAIGDRRPYNTALLVLDPAALASFAAGRSLEGEPADLASAPAVLEEIAEGVARANADLSRIEQIKRHMVLAQEWLPGGDELTPTMKLKRKPIAEKYAAEIDAMYASN